jgi:hypothetical protein
MKKKKKKEKENIYKKEFSSSRPLPPSRPMVHTH